MDPYVGEIRLVPFNFAPVGWEFCDGRLLPITDNEVLFILIGTTYGGNGITTFGLPDLRGRVPVHMSSSYAIGSLGGSETATVDLSSMPSHRHELQVSASAGSAKTPAGNFLAPASASFGDAFGSASDVQMSSNSVGPVGSGQSHANMQPYLALNYIIALYGVFPSQN